MPWYFIETLVIFWIPNLILWIVLRDKLLPIEKKSFWIALLILIPATTVMEFIYIKTRIWTFSQATDPLLGIWIAGIPIEEFSFWYGAPPFFMLTYLGLCQLGKRLPSHG